MNPSPAPASTIQSLPKTKQQVTPEEISQCLEIVRSALADVKAQNIVEMDISDRSTFTDRIIIASGTSTRHVKALADNVALDCKKAGFPPLGVEGERDAEWVLIDLGFIVVHVMLPTARTFYDLEGMWKVPAVK